MSSPELLPPPSDIRGLGPIPLPFHRNERYKGSGESRPLSAFADDDQRIITRAYESLLKLAEIAAPELGVDAPVQAFLAAVDWDSQVDEMGRFGRATTRGVSDDEIIARAIHDLRGGAFQAIICLIELVLAGYGDQADESQLFLLARDQLKIMRNAIPDLDPARSAADGAVRLHGVDLIEEKWGGRHYRIGDVQAQVRVFSEFSGAVSHRCLEFSALDRVVYNLINNAARNGDGELIEMGIFPLQEPAEDLRFVVANRIDPAHGERLAEALGESLDGLFESGFTTTGSGLGLSICAQFVGHAYGLSIPSQATASNYIGARVMDDRFVAWFHWPAG